MNFYSLHNHDYTSNVRLLDAINKPEQIVQRCMEYGFKGVALTNHECLSSGIQLLKIRDNLKKENLDSDFKIIFGNEIYLIDAEQYQNTSKYFHFILLAKDLEGYHQMRELSSRAWNRAYMEKGQFRVPTFYQDIDEIVGNNKGHLIVSSACLGGEIATDIVEHNQEGLNNFVNWLLKNFDRNDICFEMQVSDSDNQKLVNATIFKMSEYFNIRYIITTDSHYLDKNDFGVHHDFLNSKQTTERETESFYKYTYIMSQEEMKTILMGNGMTEEEVDKGFQGTCEVASQIEDFDFRHATIIPTRKPRPFILKHSLQNWYDKYPAIANYAKSQYEQDQYLLYLIEQGLVDKHLITSDNVVDEKIVDRINTELDVLWFISEKLEQRMSSYLNMVRTIIDLIWQVSLIGVSRGSAGSFLVNYLIGLVQMNPLDYNIPYWRFMNKARVDMPDIDIDIQPEKTNDVIALLRAYYGEDNVLNCISFKTESLRSAIQTASRGLGIDSDTSRSLSAMVPAKRGHVYSLKECMEGDDEQGLDPVPELEGTLKQYPNLFETVQKIEGLPTNSTIHASALYIFNEGYLAQNSLMRAPNKTKVTAYNMHDSDDMGALKFDLLRTVAQTKIRKCMDLLLQYGVIKWQGSLRATYNKYLHPDVLNYTDSKMWDAACDGKILNLFQFETPVGGLCAKKTRPSNIIQLASANALTRLQGSLDGMSPIERYVKFRDNPNEWYLEMERNGLSKEEMAILEPYLKHKFGCAIEQEDFMTITMDPHISNFSLGESNGLRKAIAKKKVKDLLKFKNLFFDKGKEVGTTEKMLTYVWNYCIQSLAGYSFSVPHDVGYSLIGLQEMNLATQYNHLFWACAILCVNAGNDFTEFTDEQEEEEENSSSDASDNNEDSEESQGANTGLTNYEKISKALTELKGAGITIAEPDINKSGSDFLPDVEQDQIVYGIRAINGVNAELCDKILNNRPYTGLQDFLDKVQPTKLQMVSLIKGGCFDHLLNLRRDAIMKQYGYIFADTKVAKKVNSDSKNNCVDAKMINTVLSRQEPFFPKEYDDAVKIYQFYTWCKANQYDAETKSFVLEDGDAIRFFDAYIKEPLLDPTFQQNNHIKLKQGISVYTSGKTIVVASTVFNKVCDALGTLPLKNIMGTQEYLDKYNDLKRYECIKKEIWDKYCVGGLSRWQFSALSYYPDEHELARVNKSKYGIVDFNSLPEELVAIGTKEGKNGKAYPIYKIVKIAGTVIKANKNKNSVALLTETGVVTVKFYAGQFNAYNSTLSKVVDGKKVRVDPSWFTRGNLIVVTGVRREDDFVPKADSYFSRHTVALVKGINSDGTLNLQLEREHINE